MKASRSTVATIAAAVLATAGCSASLGPDESGVEYNGGAIQSVSFDNCVSPGHREYRGPGDHIYVYPAGQRSYEFSDNKDSQDSAPISVVTKDNTEMTVTGVATFSLNTDCRTLRQFHEQIGLKYKAYTEDGWTKTLGTYLRQPLDRTMDQAAKQYTWKDLYSNPTIKQQWEQQVGQLIVDQVNNTAGGQFFCSPTFTGKGNCGAFKLTLQQPQPPAGVRNALSAAQESLERAAAQKNENQRIDLEAEGLRKLTKILGPDAAVLYQAIKLGRVKVVPLPAGGSINVSGD